jgi:hypothetical protein
VTKADLERSPDAKPSGSPGTDGVSEEGHGTNEVARKKL